MFRRDDHLARAALAVVGVATLTLTACGGDDGASAPPTTLTAATSTAPSTPTSTPSSSAPTDTVTSGEGTAAPNSGGVANVRDDGFDPWLRTPFEFQSQIGERYRYACPPLVDSDDTLAPAVWGSGFYTSDSSVCWSAVHIGLITSAEGGSAVIQIEPDQALYRGTLANEIQSHSYGPYGGAFRFPEADTDFLESLLAESAWFETVQTMQLQVGTVGELTCAANGEFMNVWGSGPYTTDSGICTAAVHAGEFDIAEGGTVRFEVIGDQESYAGTEANGVTSADYGPWGPSFQFIAE